MKPALKEKYLLYEYEDFTPHLNGIVGKHNDLLKFYLKFHLPKHAYLIKSVRQNSPTKNCYNNDFKCELYFSTSTEPNSKHQSHKRLSAPLCNIKQFPWIEAI